MSIDIRMFSIPALVRRVTIDTPGMQEQQQFHQQQTFPFKLYNMLEYACDSEFSSCISWSVDGKAFIIRDKDVMMAHLAPMFFNWTKFRSFTRQLNIWGFSRTEIQTGQTDGWRHNKLLRGRPDLLNEIERTQNKSPIKNSFPTVKVQALARKARTGAGSAQAQNVAVTAGESCSPSLSRVDSQAIQPYNETDRYFGIVAAATSSQVPLPFLQARHDQGSFLQHFLPNSDSLIPPPAQRLSNETATQAPRKEKAGAMDSNRYDVDTTTASASTTSSSPTSDLFVPVFDDDELMYLASIFGRDEHKSHEEELSSILSLDRESKVEGSKPN